MKGKTIKGKRGSVLFGAYMKKRREKYGISMEALCGGLCVRQELGRLEKGAWEPGYFLREALLARLGTEAETYEIFLEYQDAEQLERRREILANILRNRRAEELLEEFRLAYTAGEEGTAKEETAGGRGPETDGDCAKNRLAMQFYLGMLGQARREAASRRERYRLFVRAVEMTVPERWKITLEGLVLSACELDLVLEAERNRPQGARPEYLLDVIRYIEKGPFDGRARAKVYPKAVYLFFRSREERLAAAEEGTALTSGFGERAYGIRKSLMRGYCDSSLDVLLDNGRMYFLWEILDIQGRLLEGRMERLSGQEKWMLEDLEKLLEKNRRRRKALEQIYDTWDVGRETLDCGYAYVPKAAFCINDIIRIRRKMLGISAAGLCRGACSVDTLRRLEGRRTAGQREILRELFRRLGLSGEFIHSELETDDPEVAELLEGLREELDKCYWDEAETMLQQIRRKVDMEIPCNRQMILSVEATIRRKYNEITAEEYCRLQKEALELTVPFRCVLKRGEKYLTHMEQTCIRNMMMEMDKDSGEFMDCMEALEELCRPYMEKEMRVVAEGMHVPAMCMVGEEYADMGEHDKADWYMETVIRDALRLRKLWELPRALYGRWRNDAKRQQKGIRNDKELNAEEEISKCLILWEMARDRNKELLCQKKLEEWKVKHSL